MVVENNSVLDHFLLYPVLLSLCNRNDTHGMLQSAQYCTLVNEKFKLHAFQR